LPVGGLRVLDLFCGAGGLTFGLELSDQFTTVAGLDLLPDRVATFRSNHPHAAGLVGDIRRFSIDDLSHILDEIDVVVGGPPCQGFSSIRPFRNLTVRDKRNSLIEQFLVWVAAIKPRWFIFENVVGVLTHHQGRLLRSLLEGFGACGYVASWRVVNASLYGVPQNRERLVIVGNRTGAQFDWPTPSHRNDYKSMAGARREVIRTAPLFSQDLPEAITLTEAIGDLPEIGAGQAADFYQIPPQNEFQRWARRGVAGLSMHEATRHSRHMLDVIAHAGPNISCIPEGMVKSGYSSSYSRLDALKPSTTLTVNFVHPASNRCIHPYQNRALTPREGARIQSFPDRFRFCGTRAQIVKQIGNAVPPLLAKALGESIALADSKTTVSRASAQTSEAPASGIL
jgi:DNA (cytosine-5)-methyltransferase 1